MNQTTTWLNNIESLIKSDLEPLVAEIDQQGIYPKAFMHKLGELAGYSAAIPKQQGGLGLSLAEQLQVTDRVSRVCGSTAFVVWCQAVCAWYLLQTENQATQQRFLKSVSQGELLCGTGMSNTVKHLAGIEKMHLKAERQGDKYIVNGILPWVSNIDKDHLLIVSAQLSEQTYLMFALPCDSEGLSLQNCPSFSGMEGTQTLNVRFANVEIAADQVLAHPEQFKRYIQTIKPGFVLSQVGMGSGLVEASIEAIKQTNRTHAHVNQFLDHQDVELEQELAELKQQIVKLVPLIHQQKVNLLDVLKARALASELALKATNSAALHAGARGYLMRHAAQRRLREAMFVAIVTPALKHLRKEIHDIEHRVRAEAV